MPSTRYYSELQVDPTLRGVVVASAWSTAALGGVAIFCMDLDICWRGVAASLWTLAAAREVCVITLGYKRYQRLRIYETGEVDLQRSDGQWCSAKLLSGSVVLSRIAWLRLAPEGGGHHAELLRGGSAESDAWRRFQVIWRHLGAGD